MTIELQSILELKISEYGEDRKKKQKKFEETGFVLSVTDGVARCYGLTKVLAGEMVEFINEKNNTIVKGMALNLEYHLVRVIIFSNDRDVQQDDFVKRTHEILSISVGFELLGRVVNAIGEAVDDKGPIKTKKRSRIEKKAPGMIFRQNIREPLQTGIKIIDSLIPIGKGQRELIIGDRQTGKTSIVFDTFLNQKKSHKENDIKNQVFCIYVAIGQKRSTISELIRNLKEKDIFFYSIIVTSTASDCAPLQYLAPYAGCSLGEFFRDNGKHAIICYDDLSKQAVAYRQMSLLLRRAPGREAFPADVFYLHSRLLERSAKMSDKVGGGSLTALPIVETQTGDVSAFIPTNVISITDGQIFLDNNLFNKGQRPAISIGSSISRVGSFAQIKAMKQIIGSMKLELAQFREVQAFSLFKSELNDSAKVDIHKGSRLLEMLKQKLNDPLPIEDQIILIYIGAKGFLNKIKLKKILNFQEKWLKFIKKEYPEILKEILVKKSFSKELDTKLYSLAKNFTKNYLNN